MRFRWFLRIAVLCLASSASCMQMGTRSKSAPPNVTGASETAFPEHHANTPTRGEWGDRGDGTYTNPVMPGDFSDLDAIRLGDDYFAISSTMQYSPGVAILQSKDLVNWKIIGHVVADLTTFDPDLNWDKMSRAGRGIWAGAIRYHNGRFWTYFGTPDQGIFMSTAFAPTGPWTQPKRVLDGAGWDDPCPFWDDDGQGYLVTSRFAPEGPLGTKYNIHLFNLDAAGDRVAMSSDRVIHRSNGSEANKLYKIHGLYYHYYSEVASEGRVAMMERSRSLSGPWEIHQLMHVHPSVDKEPNQGGLIQIPSGKWYFVTHQGRGDWEGRAGVLLPITWINGWPIIGRVGPDEIGNMVWAGTKPIRGHSEVDLAASDHFDRSTLQSEWEWDYQPRADAWSLTERPGYLRLRAFPPIHTDDFLTTGNILTQRAYRSKLNEVEVTFDLSGMADGQEAGIAHFAATYGTLAILQSAGVRRLVFNNNGHRVEGPVISKSTVSLRSKWGFDGKSRFSYSVDGSHYTSFSETYQLTWGSYRGDRIGIFTVNANATGGYVDVDSFKYSIQR